MKEYENFKAHGAVMLTLKRADGTATTMRRHNIITNAGIDFLCNAFGSSTRPAAMGYIAVGTGTTAAAAGDTKLATESLRKASTYTHAAGTTKLTVTSTFAPGEATGAITEAGAVNAATGGTFFDRVVFPVINKGASDTLTVTFEITLARA